MNEIFSSVGRFFKGVGNGVVRIWRSGPNGKALLIAIAVGLTIVGAVTDDDSPVEPKQEMLSLQDEKEDFHDPQEEESSYGRHDGVVSAQDGEKEKKSSNPIKQFFGVIFLCVGGYALFESKNAAGRGRLNDILTSFGMGSFSVGLMSSFGRLVWGLIAIVCLALGLGML